MNSKAYERFRELVRQRRSLLPRKERASREVYEIASLRQVLEQLGAELAAGIAHDQDEVVALHESRRGFGRGQVRAAAEASFSRTRAVK